MMGTLAERITVVTGASRGAGHGIALALGQEGATVYITGRSSRSRGTTENLPGTIEDAAEAVTERRGTGIPVPCDHTIDQEVEALFARIRQDHGRLDLLVNNVWGGYEHYDANLFDARFWKQPRSHWQGMFPAGVRAHLVASQCAASLMVPREKGLLINTTFWDRPPGAATPPHRRANEPRGRF